ncbi:unnamed protein product, partial [Mesorhabditis belari]|uniref:Renin receptor-like C-terminal transmembrane spanning segment domain-containing protein n=1 Tax=Mesorhabditis belari TaxID=2138241 RepID=A0AAF3FCT4_9BILA
MTVLFLFRQTMHKLTLTEELQKMYNVAQFSSPDYPAVFAIIAGTTIVLTLALIYIAVFFWNIDSRHDSIIYRLTGIRAKKE